MVQRNDAELGFYKRKLSLTSGQVDDLRLKYYMSQLSVTSGNVKDLELLWLKSKGVSGTNRSDLWFNYLRSLGYTGNVEDMKLNFYQS